MINLFFNLVGNLRDERGVECLTFHGETTFELAVKLTLDIRWTEQLIFTYRTIQNAAIGYNTGYVSEWVWALQSVLSNSQSYPLRSFSLYHGLVCPTVEQLKETRCGLWLNTSISSIPKRLIVDNGWMSINEVGHPKVMNTVPDVRCGRQYPPRSGLDWQTSQIARICWVHSHILLVIDSYSPLNMSQKNNCHVSMTQGKLFGYKWEGMSWKYLYASRTWGIWQLWSSPSTGCPNLLRKTTCESSAHQPSHHSDDASNHRLMIPRITTSITNYFCRPETWKLDWRRHLYNKSKFK